MLSDNGQEKKLGNVKGSTTGSGNGEAYVRLRFNGVPTDCLLDTGAEITLIPWRLSLGVDVQPCKQQLRAARTSIPIIGRATLTGFANSQCMGSLRNMCEM